MPNSLSPVGGPVSLEKLAYDAIKEAILAFRLKPGESLVESDLAAQLNISKTPVRDALLRLEKEGLVVKVPYKGATVSEVNQQIMNEIFEIRAVLEGLAARLATPFMTPDDLERASRLVDQHEQVLLRDDPDEASRLNRQFHELIVQQAPNQWLKQILSNLDEHLKRYRTLSNFQVGRLGKSIDEHRLILKALCEGQAEQAEQAMRFHLSSVAVDLNNQDFDELVRTVSEHARSEKAT